MKELTSNETPHHEQPPTNKGYKTPMKTSKMNLNLGAIEKSGNKAPYIPTVELDVVSEDKNSIDFDRSSTFINASQLLSSKRI